MRKTTHLAITLGGLFVIKIGERVGFSGAGTHFGYFQQMLTHQMRQIALHGAHTQVDAGLAEMNGFELRMAVGHVQKRHIAKFRNVIQAIHCSGCIGLGVCAQPHARHGASTQHLKKFTFGQIHCVIPVIKNQKARVNRAIEKKKAY